MVTTLLDLVQRCPGCKRVAVWPFTQDHTEMVLYPATSTEFGILKKMFPGLETAYSVGAIVKSHRDEKGRVWHEPCWMNHCVRQYQITMQKLVNVIHTHKGWKYPLGRKDPVTCDHSMLGRQEDLVLMFGKQYMKIGEWCGLCLTKFVDGKPVDVE